MKKFKQPFSSMDNCFCDEMIEKNRDKMKNTCMKILKLFRRWRLLFPFNGNVVISFIHRFDDVCVFSPNEFGPNL